MLRHRTLAPSLHFREPNPEVDWEKTPFFVADRAAPWPSDGPRRAGVNSLGVGGTNAHVVVEEAAAPPPPAPSRGPTLVLLSARTKASLDRATARLADRLEADPSLDLADAAFTLAAGRRRFAERRAVVCASREDAVEALRSPARRLGAASDRSGTKVAFLFPGGGAQYPGMASDLYRSEPAFRARVDECLALLRTRESLDLRPLMFPVAGAEAAAAAELLRPSLALPALLTIELALAELLRSWGVTPVSMIGHSLGEYAAAHLAGVFSLADALGVVTCRGRLFETLPEGAMLSVPLPEAEVAADLRPGLSFAAINGPGLCLVSGEVGLIAGLEARLAARGVEAKRLAIAVAAHSPMLEPILGPFEKYLRSLRLAEPTLPFVSNVTGTWIRPEEARDPAYWVRHLRQPVRFADGLQALVAQGEPGPPRGGPGPDAHVSRPLAPGGRRGEVRHPGAAAPAGPHERSRGRARGHGSAVDGGRRCRLAGVLRAGTPTGQPADLLVRPRAALDRAGRRLLPPTGEADGAREEPGPLRLDLPAGVAAERDTPAPGGGGAQRPRVRGRRPGSAGSWRSSCAPPATPSTSCGRATASDATRTGRSGSGRTAARTTRRSCARWARPDGLPRRSSTSGAWATTTASTRRSSGASSPSCGSARPCSTRSPRAASRSWS